MIHTSIFQKHIHKVKFYQSANDFTQALLVMLVTNIIVRGPREANRTKPNMIVLGKGSIKKMHLYSVKQILH